MLDVAWPMSATPSLDRVRGGNRSARMIRWLTLGVVSTALIAVLPAQAEETDATSATPHLLSAPAETHGALPAAPPTLESPSAAADATAEALRKRLTSLDQASNDE